VWGFANRGITKVLLPEKSALGWMSSEQAEEFFGWHDLEEARIRERGIKAGKTPEQIDMDIAELKEKIIKINERLSAKRSNYDGDIVKYFDASINPLKSDRFGPDFDIMTVLDNIGEKNLKVTDAFDPMKVTDETSYGMKQFDAVEKQIWVRDSNGDIRSLEKMSDGSSKLSPPRREGGKTWDVIVGNARNGKGNYLDIQKALDEFDLWRYTEENKGGGFEFGTRIEPGNSDLVRINKQTLKANGFGNTGDTILSDTGENTFNKIRNNHKAYTIENNYVYEQTNLKERLNPQDPEYWADDLIDAINNCKDKDYGSARVVSSDYANGQLIVEYNYKGDTYTVTIEDAPNIGHFKE
jgi:hypothetical protein